VNYIKPDVICGTESWLHGVKPGKNPTLNAIKSSEIFPENYVIYRNDRETKGGGFFIAIHTDLSSTECVEFITDCELSVAKICVKSLKNYLR